MIRKIKVPSPQELEKANEHYMSDIAYELLKAIIEILREKYVGKPLVVKLKDISAKAGLARMVASHEDWEKMEHELRKVGWSIGYESPDIDESFDSYFKFGQKK